MPKPVTIAAAGLRAEIAPLGAELVRLQDRQGRDLQWGGDPAVWKGRAPILFPIVGTLAGGQYRVDGASFALPRHGFARTRLFSLVEASPSRARFRLEWDAQTLRVYPFRFALDMAFALAGTRLDITATVTSLETEKILPASFGFHPAFAWPLPYGRPRAGHRIVFAREEPAPVRRLDGDGLLLPEGFATPVEGRRLVLRDALFAWDALILDRIESRSLRYGAEDGPQLEIEFPEARQLGLWTRPGADFLCIEPWNGFADPQGFEGDFRDKPGVFLVPPGRSRVCAMSIRIQD